MPKIDQPKKNDPTLTLLVDRVNRHCDVLEYQHKLIEEIHDSNKAQDARLGKIENDIKKIVEIFSAGEGAVTTIRWIGKFAMWIGAMCTAVYSIYLLISNWPDG